jgi:hypothetical protein
MAMEPLSHSTLICSSNTRPLISQAGFSAMGRWFGVWVALRGAGWFGLRMNTTATGRMSFASKPIHVGIVIAAVSVAVVSFILSFSALTAVASWAGVPAGLVWAVPVVIDASIVVYAGASLDFRSRGESARLSSALVLVFTALSVMGNAAHANAETIPGSARAVIGTLLAVAAPMSVFLITHILGQLIAAPTEAVLPSSFADPKVNFPAVAAPTMMPQEAAKAPTNVGRGEADRGHAATPNALPDIDRPGDLPMGRVSQRPTLPRFAPVADNDEWDKAIENELLHPQRPAVSIPISQPLAVPALADVVSESRQTEPRLSGVYSMPKLDHPTHWPLETNRKREAEARISETPSAQLTSTPTELDKRPDKQVAVASAPITAATTTVAPPIEHSREHASPTGSVESLASDIVNVVKEPANRLPETPKPKTELNAAGKAAWVRQLAAEGKTQRDIAELTGLSKSTVQRYLAFTPQ